MTRFFILIAALIPSIAYPWGDMGHRIIAQNAIELIHPEIRALFTPYKSELGYYANLPDTVWKSDPATYKLESPTHYLNSENFKRSPADPKFPENPAAAKKLFRAPAERPDAAFNTNGTAPWRIKQFHELLISSFEKAKAGRVDDSAAGVNSGLLAHYVSDIAQPFHAATDFDGIKAGHGGIHSYLETAVVDHLALRDGLTNKSLQLAVKNQKRWRKGFQSKSEIRIALDLLMDGHRLIPEIYKLDKLHALRPSGSTGFAVFNNGVARYPAEKTARYFAPLIQERIALGSVALAEIIDRAWIAAGKPKLSSIFGSFIKKPLYIAPNYIP